MNIKYTCPFWGSENLSPKEFIENVVEAGYDGVEVNFPSDEIYEKELLKAIRSHTLILVGQQWLEPKDESVKSYSERMEKLLYKRADLNPLFINSHTGKDYFSFDDNCRIIEKCFDVEEKTGIKIIHETHRGRFCFNAATTSLFLDKFPELKLNADFSHWTTVSESLLEDQTASLSKAIKKSDYIHARVGHTQSPQVNTPFAPENKIYLDQFVTWWKKILQNAKDLGKQEFYVCPEFGPWPYMPSIPFTDMPVANQWELNKKMLEYLRKNLS